MIRVFCYIDGFNIYHAIDDGVRASRGAKNYLKWLDLWALMNEFIDVNVHKIESVKFFTAYPKWNSARLSRHKNYTAALRHRGVEVVEGHFKQKEVFCKNCKTTFQANEEKESDVNIAMHMINDAHCNRFDVAFLITNDSDLLGPVRMVKHHIAGKKIKIIAPPFRSHSKELWAAADGRAKIKEVHLEKCLLPERFADAKGDLVFERPTEYEPPR